MALETLAKFAPEEILPLISKHSKARSSLTVNGQEMLIKIATLRLQVFKRSLVCVSCGLVGSIFLLQKQINRNESPHLNLYAIRRAEPSHEEYVLMTKDHILPVSRGGKDVLCNLQTMQV